MNIDIVLLDITHKNGIERVTTSLANLFVKEGIRVNIVSLFSESGVPGFSLDSHVKVFYLTEGGYKSNKNVFYRLNTFIKGGICLRKHFRNRGLSKDEIIIGQCFFVNLLLWIIGLGSRTIVCEHFKYTLYPLIIRKIRNYVYKKSACVVTLTDNDRENFSRYLNNVITIPNMVVNDGLHSNLTQKRILSVGRLHFQKGYDLLILAVKDVFEKHSDWILDIYGEGEMRDQLLALINKEKLERHVFLKGYTEHIDDEYLKYSFYVLSSRYEGLPMVLLEALSKGLPVVAFKCPEGPAELLNNGGGLLIEAENVKALSDGILTMIENKELRFKCANEGLIIAQKYSPDAIFQRWNSLFVKLGVKC